MSLNRIANIDVKGGYVWMLILDSDGKARVKKKRYQYYMLSSEKKNSNWHQLKGNNHYRFIRFYNTKKEFITDYRFNKKNAFAIFNDQEAARIIDGIKQYEGLSPKDLCTLVFDIETNGLTRDSNSKIFIIANTVYKNGQIIKRIFTHDQYKSQGDLIVAWVSWANEIDPEILAAYSGYNFDIPYLVHVASLHGVKLNLGRDGSEIEISDFTSEFRKDGSQSYSYHDVRIFLRSFVDVMFLVIKADAASRVLDSYGLKSVIKQLGLEKEGRQHYDAPQIATLHKDPIEWEKIKAYAQGDTDDTLTLFDKFIPPYFALSKLITMSIQDTVNCATGKQVNNTLIASYLTINHSIPKASETIKYEGGKTVAIPGLYLFAVRFDVSSLYPHVLLHYKLSNGEKDPRGHLLKMLSDWTSQRLAHKARYQETGDPEAKAMSDSLKIGINSIYGMLGAPGLCFNSPEHSELCTKYGREILTRAIEWAEGKGFTVFFGDTDSIAFCKQGHQFDKDERKSLISELNDHFPPLINFEEDGVYDRYLIVSKKNYITKQGDKIIIKGASLKGTSREPALKEFLQRSLIMILEGSTGSVAQILSEYKTEIENVQDIKRWASKKTFTKAVMNSRRTYERKLRAALSGSSYREGDKFYIYFTETDDIKLAENWTNDHSKERLLEKLDATYEIFSGVVPNDK